MRARTLTAALAATAALLAGCSDADTTTNGTTDAVGTSAAAGSTAAGEEAAATSGAVDAAAMTDPTCQEFFGGAANPLAKRATDTLAQLEAGEIVDPATWGQMNLLSQRLTTLTDQAEGEAATLLERINKPFLEGSDAILSSKDQTPTDPELKLPKIDVADAKAASEEMVTFCQG